MMIPTFNARRSARDFQELCRQALVELGFNTQVEARIEGLPVSHVDLVATNDRDTIFAEVKWTHRSSVYLRVLREWAAQTAKLVVPGSETRVILMVSGMVAADHKKWAEQEFAIEIWDILSLIALSSSPSLTGRLQQFRNSFDGAIPDTCRQPTGEPGTRTDHETGRRDRREAGDGREQSTLADDDLLSMLRDDGDDYQPEGEQLIVELSDVKKGKKGAAAYELLCQRIISYLFRDALAEPKKHKRSTDGLSIMDIVYRVIPGHRFWDTLTRDFRARVIVFECKNYNAGVGPMQVYTSERYINPLALRPICFMMTRQAPSKHARLAAFGAMREGGKMMIFLDDESVKAMLRLRDGQVAKEANTLGWYDNDPTIELEARIYELLAEIPR